MKFTMISKAGEGAHLLYKIYEEGNEVNLFIKEEGYKSVWKGILPQNPLKFDDRNEIYIFDSSGLGNLADKLKKHDFKVFGASSFADKLEDDREFGIKMMQKCGIKIPEYKNFKKIKDSYEYIKKSKDRLVFKPSGDLPSKLTYVSSDAEDLLEYLEYVEKYYGNQIEDFVLQQFIEGNIVSSEYWCDGTKFVGQPNQTIEVKKLMNDDIGPATGCAGNLIWLADPTDKVIANGISLIENECIVNDYIGCIDLNAIISGGVPYGLEWTPRFGLDAMPTLLQLLDCDLGNLIYSFAANNGKLELKNEFAAGVRLSIPPYPLEPKKVEDTQKVSPNVGIPIRGIPSKFKDNMYFYEIQRSENGGFEHCDGTGAIFVASTSSDNLDTVFDIPYEICECAKIPDKQYRTDLNKVLPEMYRKLKSNKE